MVRLPWRYLLADSPTAGADSHLAAVHVIDDSWSHGVLSLRHGSLQERLSLAAPARSLGEAEWGRLSTSKRASARFQSAMVSNMIYAAQHLRPAHVQISGFSNASLARYRI